MDSCKCCSPDGQISRTLEKISSLLKLVADPSRIKIMCILRANQSCVCDLVEKIKLSQSLISHHLSDLKKADLVCRTKRGQKVYYSLTPKGKNITNLIFKIKS